MSQKIIKLVWLWLPVFVWMGLIFTLSSWSTVPGTQKVWWDFVVKKLAHMFEYAVLFFLIMRALGRKSSQMYAIAFVWCILYALSDEYHQSLVPGRHPKLMDVGYDTLGASIVYLRMQGWI